MDSSASEVPELDRVNEQPPVILGLSQSELNWAMLSGFVVTPILLALLFSTFWIWWIGLVISPFAGLGVIRLFAFNLCRLKIGKPDNYYPLLIKQKFEQLMGTSYTKYSGAWAILRRNRYEGRQ